MAVPPLQLPKRDAPAIPCWEFAAVGRGCGPPEELLAFRQFLLERQLADDESPEVCFDDWAEARRQTEAASHVAPELGHFHGLCILAQLQGFMDTR